MESKTTASYLVTAALAASLGYVGGLQGAGVSEVQASPQKRKPITNMTLTPEGKSCFEVCIDSAICASVDSRLGLSGVNACSAAKHAKSFNIQTQRGNTDNTGAPLADTMTLSGTSEHDGQWTPGVPQ